MTQLAVGDGDTMMFRCGAVVFLLWLSLGGVHEALAAPGTRSTKVLVPASADRIGVGAIKSACGVGLPTALCDPLTTSAWMVRNASPQEPIYLIDKSVPKLIQLDAAHATPSKVWDFSSYQHSHSMSDPEGSALLSIYPALYPVGARGEAVAVIRTINEMYSGGGATFEVADFVSLNSASSWSLLYASVPFACEKMIRACFSEEDYKEKHPNCHDIYSGSLRITFPGASNHHAPWRFTWIEDGQTRFSVPRHGTSEAHEAVKSVPFCDGGPAHSR